MNLLCTITSSQLDKNKVIKVIESVFDPLMSGHHYSSMYHDIQKGRPTEIDYLNGAIIQKTLKHQIAVPYNSLIYHLVKILENKNVPV